MVSTKPSPLVAQRTSDRILLLADSYGFPVTLYGKTDVPYTARAAWTNKLIPYAIIHAVALVTLSAVLFATVQLLPATSYRRAGMAFLGIAFIKAWPVWLGDTGLPTLNFGVPALGFLVTLHIIDIFFVRPPHEVKKWGPLRFVAQLLAFPNEDNDQKWWRTPLSAPGLVVKILLGNLFLYITPPAEIYNKIKPWSWPYIFYSMSTGMMVLFTLGLVVDLVFVLISFTTQMEMQALFQNPLGASVGIRDFWSRWNCAVKTSLARAVFKLLQSPEPTPVSRRLRRDLANAGSRFRPGFTKKGDKRFVDPLDETETELDSAPPSTAASPATSDTEGDPRRRSLRNRNAPKALTPVQNGHANKASGAAVNKEGGKGRKKSGQLIKVFAALSTFFVSGAFHEEMLWASLPRQFTLTGENLAFFMIHGAVMCLTTVLGRMYPRLIPKNKWLGWLGVQILLWVTTPLFVAPFARAGFFEHLKAMSVYNWHRLGERAGPVAGFVWLVKI